MSEELGGWPAEVVEIVGRTGMTGEATQVNVRDIRGNIDTRIKKLERKEYDAILLAYAGLKR